MNLPLVDNMIFVNEDICKPENRINLSLFGLFLVDEFRYWFLKRLSLPADSSIFPSVNLLGGIRPDFAVHDLLHHPLAYIEVECCGENDEQLKRFRKNSTVRIISIAGKLEDNCDLSLVEIYNNLTAMKNGIKNQQLYKNLAHFEKLIVENVIGQRSIANPPDYVSKHMKDTPVVKGLFENLRIIEDIDSNFNPGEFRIETKKENGFTLRIYSRISSIRKSLSVMNQTSGRPTIWFPSKIKLLKYLPKEKHYAVEEYSTLLLSLGCPISHLEETKKASLGIGIVEKNIKKFTEIINKLGSI